MFAGSSGIALHELLDRRNARLEHRQRRGDDLRRKQRHGLGDRLPDRARAGVRSPKTPKTGLTRTMRRSLSTIVMPTPDCEKSASSCASGSIGRASSESGGGFTVRVSTAPCRSLRGARRRERSSGRNRGSPAADLVYGQETMTALEQRSLVHLTHLQRLEAESIHIMREVVAEFEQAGDALLDRQGQRGDAAPGAEGVLPGEAAVPAAARRHDLEVPRRCSSSATAWPRELGLDLLVHMNPEGAGAGHQPVHARLGGAHRHLEDRGAEAGARQVRLRRRVRRRPPRRGEVARQGARLLVPLARSTAGTRRTSGRSCGASTTRASSKGESDPRVPAVELDRARRLAVHLPREHPDRAALLRRASGRSSSATAR